MANNKYDTDEELDIKFDFAQVKRLFSYVAPHKKRMGAALFVMLSSAFLANMLPKLFQVEMDNYIPNADIQSIVRIALVAAAICIYLGVCARLKVSLTIKLGQDIIHQIREDIFSHLQELPFSYYDERSHGKIQVRVVNYVNNLSDILSNGILQAITDLFNLFFIIGFMLSMSVRLTLICLCGLPVLLAVIAIIRSRQHRAWQVQSNKQSNLNGYISESINGIRVTQAFVRERKNKHIFNRLSMQYRHAWMNASYYGFVLGPTVDLVSTITTAFIYVLGVSAIAGGTKSSVTVGVLVAFTAYITRFWTPINTIASFYNNMITAISYLERIFETIDEPVKVKNAPDAKEMPKIAGKVCFEHVSFSYEDGFPVLNDISFQVQQGEMIALVGPTGAGKSTIVSLLSRFYDVGEGKILIDNEDISRVTLASLRSQMGVMMQDSFLFSGTIMDNIRYGNQTVTDEEVIRAAKTVCAHDFIMQMEDGYQTQVSEQGSRLSVGQRQLIAFARALLADPAILILDEATSCIDTETEAVLQEGLRQLLKGRTSFVIAHRLSTIKDADRIFVIDDGKIEEEGTHEELFAQKGKYYDLCMAQEA